MGKAEADWLAHYSSPYYDPAKAHEYYMRTRKLTPRAAPTTQNQKEGLKYAGDKIAGNKAAELKKLSDTTNKTITTSQKRAEESRKRIASKAKELRIKIIQRQMENLLKIPKGASPEQVARITQQNRQEMARATQRANGELRKVNDRARAVIAKARASYKSGKENIDRRYDKASTRETANIRANVR